MKKEEIEAYFDDIAEAMQAVWSKYGWRQSNIGDDTEGYCLWGGWYRATNQIDCNGESTSQAITDAKFFLTLNTAFSNAVAVAIDTIFPNSPTKSVIGFNDDCSRSEEDVRLVSKHAVTSMADYME
jgi:hypothetical protein